MWDKEKSIIEAPTYEHNIYINNIDGLVEYLEQEIIDEMNGRMPVYWLKENTPLDYTTEVKEYLYDHHLDDIKSLGWSYDSL